MKKIITVLFLVFSIGFISCDQEFNTIGADLVGDEHFDFSTHEVGLKAYSVATNEVQTNNLPINPIGIYNNPYFGQTKSNFVTQLALVSSKPKFGTSVQVENVILYVPYFSKVETTNSDGSKGYSLDSIYGSNKESKMNLSVYENGYFLSGLDPSNNLESNQQYYTNSTSNSGVADFENLKRGADLNNNSVQGGNRLNNSSDVAENDQFFFNKNEIVVYKKKFNSLNGNLEYLDENDLVTTDPAKYVVKERLAPGMYLSLNKDFFKKRILETSSINLNSNNDFRQYFKGLYFKIEQNIGEEGAMAMINFNNAKLQVNYSSIDEGASVGALPTSKTFTMSLGSVAKGNSVSLQNFSYNGNYSSGLFSPANDYTNPSNPIFGQNERLYVKGGKGSVVYMDLFGDEDVLGEDGLPYFNPITSQPGNDIPDELDILRLKGWLINDAYLEFYVDKIAMSGNSESQEPDRLYLFDATNQKQIVDCLYDTSVGSNLKKSKVVFGGIVQRDESIDGKALKYKIRITQHINNLINSNNRNLNENIRLGLCVTESIAITSNYYYKNPIDLNNTTTISQDDIKFFPVSSIMSHQGVVLHGTASTDVNKKLKLIIHYTKPN
jgi:hypothetical protein